MSVGVRECFGQPRLAGGKVLITRLPVSPDHSAATSFTGRRQPGNEELFLKVTSQLAVVDQVSEFISEREISKSAQSESCR